MKNKNTTATIKDEPMTGLKACSFFLSELNVDTVDHVHAHHGMRLISNLFADATSTIEDEKNEQ